MSLPGARRPLAFRRSHVLRPFSDGPRLEAADGSRTHDLILTKDALYQLSYSSVEPAGPRPHHRAGAGWRHSGIAASTRLRQHCRGSAGPCFRHRCALSPLKPILEPVRVWRVYATLSPCQTQKRATREALSNRLPLSSSRPHCGIAAPPTPRTSLARPPRLAGRGRGRPLYRPGPAGASDRPYTAFTAVPPPALSACRCSTRSVPWPTSVASHPPPSPCPLGGPGALPRAVPASG